MADSIYAKIGFLYGLFFIYKTQPGNPANFPIPLTEGIFDSSILKPLLLILLDHLIELRGFYDEMKNLSLVSLEATKDPLPVESTFEDSLEEPLYLLCKLLKTSEMHYFCFQ